MRMSKTFYGFIFVASLLTGCSSDVEIRGEVFLEKDGKPIFLSNTEIMLIPENDFKQHVKLRYAEVPEVAEGIKANLLKNIEMERLLENSTEKLNKFNEGYLLAKQAELRAMPDQHKLAVIRSFGSLPGAAAAIAEEKNRFIDAQVKTLSKKKSLLYGLLAADVVRQAIKERWSNPSSPGLDDKKFTSMIADAERIYAGKASDGEITRIAMNYGNKSRADALADIEKSFEENEALSKELNERSKTFENRLNGLVNGQNGEFYYPKPAKDVSVISGFTGSDGKFEFKVNKGNRMALVANKDNLYWFLWVKSNEDVRLALTEKNLLSSDCYDCVFNKKANPEDF